MDLSATDAIYAGLSSLTHPIALVILLATVGVLALPALFKKLENQGKNRNYHLEDKKLNT